MINLISINGIASTLLCEIVAIISRISLIKLIDGGAAILAQINKNHHILRIGMHVSNPRVSASLRVWVIS